MTQTSRHDIILKENCTYLQNVHLFADPMGENLK